MKKKTVIIIGIVVAVLAIAVVAAVVISSIASGGSDTGDGGVPVTKVCDDQVSENRYSGIVEMGEVVSVKKSSDLTINKTFVKEGDTVKKGDKLFEYDVEQMELQLSKSQLELDQAQAAIAGNMDKISALESQKSSAADENELLDIDNQILDLQMSIKQNEVDASSKQAEVDKLKESIENSVVKSEVNGKVQKIASLESENESTDNTYMTIATTDNFRVKATVSEMNIETFSEKAPILIRSRKDESKTWTGEVSFIDKSSPVAEDGESGVGQMMGGSDQENADSKYYVYVTIDDAKDLIVGQHVTIELGSEDPEATDGVFIYAEYVVDAETNPYVWCKGKDGKLEKRSVELGEYNDSTYEYEILKGLTKDDYIAFPESRLTEGMPVVTPEDESDAMGVS